jgi:hypothetical protein
MEEVIKGLVFAGTTQDFAAKVIPQTDPAKDILE